MRWLKRDIWKLGITLAGLLFFLVFMVGVPVLADDTHERASGFTGPVMGAVQATPTEDMTVTALNKEKLQHENDWWWSNGAGNLAKTLETAVCRNVCQKIAMASTLFRPEKPFAHLRLLVLLQ